MPRCDCGSYAVNHHCHGRDGSDNNLCDVCYWRSRANDLAKHLSMAINIIKSEYPEEQWDEFYNVSQMQAALDRAKEKQP